MSSLWCSWRYSFGEHAGPASNSNMTVRVLPHCFVHEVQRAIGVVAVPILWESSFESSTTSNLRRSVTVVLRSFWKDVVHSNRCDRPALRTAAA